MHSLAGPDVRLPVVAVENSHKIFHAMQACYRHCPRHAARSTQPLLTSPIPVACPRPNAIISMVGCDHVEDTGFLPCNSIVTSAEQAHRCKCH
eukprot:5062850-Amphidinium_carterae.1